VCSSWYQEGSLTLFQADEQNLGFKAQYLGQPRANSGFSAWINFVRVLILHYRQIAQTIVVNCTQIIPALSAYIAHDSCTIDQLHTLFLHNR
jgi:hypothetical protein